MKNILILILLLISATSYAQIINDNTDVNTSGNQLNQALIWDGANWVNRDPGTALPGYPFFAFYENRFESNINGVSAFNGASVSNVGGKLQVIAGASARGALIGTAKTEGNKYFLKITISGANPVLGIRLGTEWADFIQNPIFDGTYYFQFTEPLDANGDEKLVVASNTIDTFFIDEVAIYTINEFRSIQTQADIDVLLSQKQDSIDSKISEARYFDIDAGMYYNSFDEASDASRLINPVNVTAVWDDPNNALDVTTTSSTDRFYIGEQPTKRYSYQSIYLDISNVTDTLYLSVGQTSSDVLMITSSGIYERVFYFDAVISVASLFTNRAFIVSGKSGVSYQINEFRQSQFSDPRKALYADATIGTEAGFGADAGDSDGVAIGRDAIALSSLLYSGAAGAERTAIGETSRALAWRATAIGGNAFAGSTSSTAIGSGAVSLQTHGMALGRGAIVPSLGWVPFEVNFSFAEKELYFNNGWGHRFNLPISKITKGDTPSPSAVEIKLHGQDAYDARYPIYNAGTTYASGAWVQRNDSVFISKVITTGNDPGLGVNWSYLYNTDAGGGPSDYNVDAGDFSIYAGRATGTGTSGSVNLYVAEGNNGQNTKDTPKKAMELRSDEALTTGTFLWLLNEATGTMQRMVIDTKPAVSGANGIIGFSKGYKPE